MWSEPRKTILLVELTVHWEEVALRTPTNGRECREAVPLHAQSKWDVGALEARQPLACSAT